MRSMLQWTGIRLLTGYGEVSTTSERTSLVRWVLKHFGDALACGAS